MAASQDGLSGYGVSRLGSEPGAMPAAGPGEEMRALTLSELSTGGYYLYLAFYNVIYVLPLLAIVVAFSFTLGSRKLSAAEGRLLKLLSGLMMLGLGAVLILAPGLLDNGLVAIGLLFLAAGITWIFHRLDKRRNRPA